jgi:hypothetical protein
MGGPSISVAAAHSLVVWAGNGLDALGVSWGVCLR